MNRMTIFAVALGLILAGGAGAQDPNMMSNWDDLAPAPAAAPGVIPPPGTPPNGPALSGGWVSVEFLAWRIKQAPLPPLITTGSPADAAPGALGQPNTHVLFGGSNVNYGVLPGGRITAGQDTWDDGSPGFQASAFGLGQVRRRAGFASDPTGNPVLAQPIVNAVTGAESSVLTSFPGLLAGNLTASTSTLLYGVDSDLFMTVRQDRSWRLDALAGFRYLALREDLRIGSSVAPLTPGLLAFGGTPVDPGSLLFSQDRFRTANDFYGGQVGGRFLAMFERLGVELVAKVAFGVNQHSLDVNGSTLLATPGTLNRTLPGGVLALNSNSGHFFRNDFAVVPELGVNALWDLRSWLRLRAGYSMIYLSDAARPGNQIDRVIDPGRVPSDPTFGTFGPRRPMTIFHDSDFWAQGVSLGLEFLF
jgi:hypothetical protein